MDKWFCVAFFPDTLKDCAYMGSEKESYDDAWDDFLKQIKMFKIKSKKYVFSMVRNKNGRLSLKREIFKKRKKILKRMGNKEFNYKVHIVDNAI